MIERNEKYYGEKASLVDRTKISVLAGGVAGLFSTPFEVSLVRQQAASTLKTSYGNAFNTLE